MLLTNASVQEPVYQAVKVEHREKISDVILYRGWQDDGEHSEKYCVELQFKNKKTAISWLKRHRLSHREIPDHEPLPWISAP